MIGQIGWRLAVIAACLAVGDAAHAAPPASTATNLVMNGSFEKVADGKPVGWELRRWSGDATLDVLPLGHASKGCVLIASEKGADFSLATRVAVEPFAHYRLSGWIKTDDVCPVGGRGAMINIHDIPEAASTALTGTHDWTRVEVVFNTFGQDHLWVHCCLGGWGKAMGKAWFDELALRQIGRYKLDYSYLFQKGSPDAPHIAYYGGKTAIAERAFEGAKPSLDAGKEGVHWRLVCGPDGMTVDADSGAPSWQEPAEGHYRVQIEAKNSAGRDIMEFMLIVVKNDVPDGQVVVTKHMDFVLPPEGVRWFDKWKPHAMLDAQFEYLRKLIGHEPARDGKQVVKFQPDMGGGAHSGNPAPVGPGFWRWDDVRGWGVGIWFHEVGHNFNGQAPITFYSNVEGFGDMYHHHCHFLAGPLFMRTVADPAAFGLSGAAADNCRRCTELGAQGLADECKDYEDWLKKGGKVRTYQRDHFHLWCMICNQLGSQYGAEVMEKSLRAMRTDGIPAALRETAKTPLQHTALVYCIMSHAAGADLRPFFDRMGFEYDGAYYKTIDTKIGEIVKNLPDEDDLDGWKRNPQNGHFYRRTMLDSNWHAAEVEARQCGGHLATIRNAQELQWLQSRFEIYPFVWIGGFQGTERQHEWRWISGERSQFTSWEKGPPAAGKNPTFAILVTASGKWQAKTSPAQIFPGIIEVEAKPPTLVLPSKE